MFGIFLLQNSKYYFKPLFPWECRSLWTAFFCFKVPYVRGVILNWHRQTMSPGIRSEWTIIIKIPFSLLFCESHSGNFPWEEQTLKLKCATVPVQLYSERTISKRRQTLDSMASSLFRCCQNNWKESLWGQIIKCLFFRWSANFAIFKSGLDSSGEITPAIPSVMQKAVQVAAKTRQIAHVAWLLKMVPKHISSTAPSWEKMHEFLA